MLLYHALRRLEAEKAAKAKEEAEKAEKPVNKPKKK